MSRKAEYDNTGAEDPRGDGDLPEWLEEEIAGKSKREQERIIRGYREVKKIRPVRSTESPRRNPYVESGAYIIPDNDINKRAARMA
jgi:hypothetical protein